MIHHMCTCPCLGIDARALASYKAFLRESSTSTSTSSSNNDFDPESNPDSPTSSSSMLSPTGVSFHIDDWCHAVVNVLNHGTEVYGRKRHVMPCDAHAMRYDSTVGVRVTLLW